MIEEAPLQAYLSALIFAPAKSKVRQLFSDHLPSALQQLNTISEDWSLTILVFEGHNRPVESVAYSPDGHFLASASSGDVKLWNAQTGVLIGTFGGHSDHIDSIAFSPDGQCLVSSSAELVRFWSVKTQTACGILELGPGKTDEALCGNGELPMASQSLFETPAFREARARASLQGVEDVSGRHCKLAFSPNGEFVAVAGEETVNVRNTKTGAIHSTHERPPRWVRAITFSPDGKLIAGNSRFGDIEIWDVDTGTSRGTMELYTPSGRGDGYNDPRSLETVRREIAFSPNSQLLALTDDDRISIWSVRSCLPYGRLTGHRGPVTALAFFPDGVHLASGSSDKTVRAWDVGTKSQLDLNLGSLKRDHRIVFTPGGRYVASAESSWTTRLWKVSTGEYCAALGNVGRFDLLAFSPDDTTVVKMDSRPIELVDLETGNAYATLQGPWNKILWVNFSLDGKYILSASSDSRFRLWKADSGACCGAWVGETMHAIFAFSSDSRFLALTVNCHITLLSTRPPTLYTTLRGHTTRVNALAYSMGNKFLASASSEGNINVWDIGTSTLISTLEGHSDCINSLSFSSDGALLASASQDTTVKL
jgi:WD40 repeat protein